jgi:hypothetical protein
MNRVKYYYIRKNNTSHNHYIINTKIWLIFFKKAALAQQKPLKTELI